jgi:phosphoglycerate dehydrogenase-like enzyme
LSTRRAVFNMRDERPVWAPPAWVFDALRAAFPSDWTFIDVDAPVSGRGDGGGLSDAAIEAIAGAEIYFGLGLPRPLLQAAVRPPVSLRWIHTGAAGVASLLHPELTEHDIVLTNSAGVHAEPMAETVIAMILHFARGIDYAVRAQAQREWRTAPFEKLNGGVREIAGATLGIVGLGGIGRAVARRGQGLGMHVVATRRTDSPHDDGMTLRGDDALQQLLARSDYVVVTLPATAQTQGLIGAAELSLMRTDAVLINVARGSIVEEGALTEVLQQGRLRGAALDVFGKEPLSADSPLWTLDNVLITPHVSATSARYWEREAELMLDNLRRYLDGAELRNVVDVSAGY